MHVMNANERSSIRKRLKVYVDLYNFEEYLGLYQTRNITLDGAFIENVAGNLYPGELLELRFHVQDGEPNPLCLRATVARSTGEGVAVLFDYGVQEYRRLLNTISTYASDGHARTVPGFWYVGNSVH